MKKVNALKISLIAVVFGLLTGFLIIAVTNRNPYNLVVALVRSMAGFNLLKPDKPINVLYILNWFLETMPIILTGLSVAFAFRTGLFNIGGEGQYMLGCTAAAYVALFVKAPFPLHPILCILAGLIAGGIWGFIPGILKAFKNIHEVVVCIMLNYIAWYLTSWFVRAYLPINPNTGSSSINFPESAIIPTLNFGTSSQFNYGIIVVVIALVIFHVVIEKTTFGYSLRATGLNFEAARYAGMKTKFNICSSMFISGAFSGIAGAVTILGVYHYGRTFQGFDGYGFDGISVALVGASNGIGILFSGLLFGLLKTTSNNLQLFNIPKEVGELIQGAIIFVVAAQYIIIYLEEKLSKKKGEFK